MRIESLKRYELSSEERGEVQVDSLVLVEKGLGRCTQKPDISARVDIPLKLSVWD